MSAREIDMAAAILVEMRKKRTENVDELFKTRLESAAHSLKKYKEEAEGVSFSQGEASTPSFLSPSTPGFLPFNITGYSIKKRVEAPIEVDFSKIELSIQRFCEEVFNFEISYEQLSFMSSIF